MNHDVSHITVSCLMKSFILIVMSRHDMSRNDLRFCVISLGTSMSIAVKAWTLCRWFLDLARWQENNSLSHDGHVMIRQDWRAHANIMNIARSFHEVRFQSIYWYRRSQTRSRTEWKDCCRRNFFSKNAYEFGSSSVFQTKSSVKITEVHVKKHENGRRNDFVA